MATIDDPRDDAVKLTGQAYIESLEPAKNWGAVLNGNTEAKKWQDSPDRKALLREGLYLKMDRFTAESWVSALRTRGETAAKAAAASGQTLETSPHDTCVVTIVDIPDATRNTNGDGKITIRVDGPGIEGVEADIFASLFYNSIKPPPSPTKVILSDGPFTSFNDPSNSQPSGGWG